MQRDLTRADVGKRGGMLHHATAPMSSRRGDNGELGYRRPGTPSWVSIMHAHTGAILWADGQDCRRVPRHFAGIGKVDRLVAFLAGS
ncbi:hypothetical protein [Mycobacteroides sp. PCS013]|uniref:hypothetical protein n=1 Tax=Mycobacteroides sp. PCS013 TaxID=3074106 RepID=UPI003C300E04